MGAATVSLQRAFGPRKEALAALRVTLNGVVAADVLVSLWEQLVRPLRDGYATVTWRLRDGYVTVTHQPAGATGVNSSSCSAATRTATRAATRTAQACSTYCHTFCSRTGASRPVPLHDRYMTVT